MIKSSIKVPCQFSFFVIGCLVAGLNLCACQESPTLAPKHRPPNVPSDAKWVGGADGGAYVRCGIDLAQNVNPCSVWNDNTGALVESGDYKLVKEQRAANQAELQITFPDFDGQIYLKGGLVLKRQ